MKYTALLTITLAAIATADVLPLKFDILKGKTLASAVKKTALSNDKRDTEIIDLVDESTYYAATISIDDTDFKVLVDTGSSDLWVFGANNPWCSSSSSSHSDDNRKRDTKERKLSFDPKKLLDSEKKNNPDLQAILAEKKTGASKDKKLNPDVSILTGKKSLFDKRALSDEIEGTDDGAPATNTATQSVNPDDEDVTTLPASLATIDCQEYGTLDTDSSSSSFNDSGNLFFIQYGDDTYALGTWGTANVTFGDFTVKNFTFAVANDSNSTIVMGVGLAGNEASTASLMDEYNENGSFEYANLPLALKDQGSIEKALFSLYMDYESGSGAILFGGIDHAKYSGDLVTVPLLNFYADSGHDDPITFDVEVKGISVFDGSNNVTVLNTSISALLDSGTSLTYLPEDTIAAIVKVFSAKYDESSGFYVIDCPTGTSDVVFTYTFDGVSIDVPLVHVLSSLDSSGEQCALLFIPSDRYILGDTFLRDAYVVFDLDDLEVQIAQYSSSGDEDIETVGAGSSGSGSKTSTASGTVTSLESSDEATTLSATASASGSVASSSESSASLSSNGVVQFDTISLSALVVGFLAVLV